MDDKRETLYDNNEPVINTIPNPSTLESLNSPQIPINPVPSIPTYPTSIIEQKIETKKPKSNKIQVILISIVAFSISIFMLLSLAFNIKLLHINGTSMSPTVTEDNWVISTSHKKYTYGDIIAFYHNNVIMIKRVIALPGDTISIDSSGNVYVNDNLVDEPYLSSKALGDPEVDFPHTVHAFSYFVLGDNRIDSIDSRNIAIRDIKETDIIGKVSYSLIPFKHLS